MRPCARSAEGAGFRQGTARAVRMLRNAHCDEAGRRRRVDAGRLPQQVQHKVTHMKSPLFAALLGAVAGLSTDRNSSLDARGESQPYAGPIPDRMESENTPTRVLVAFDVY